MNTPTPSPEILTDAEFKALCYRWTATGQVVGFDVLQIQTTLAHWKSRAEEAERQWRPMEFDPSVEIGTLRPFLVAFQSKIDGHRFVREMEFLNEHELECDDPSGAERTTFSGWFSSKGDGEWDINYEQMESMFGNSDAIAWADLPSPPLSTAPTREHTVDCNFAIYGEPAACSCGADTAPAREE